MVIDTISLRDDSFSPPYRRRGPLHHLGKAAAARQFNVTPKIVAKWVKRFCAEGVDGLRDRSSRPHSLPSQTPAAACAAVEALRRQRHTGKQIATEVGISPATVSRILRRLRLNRLAALEPAEPIRRYEREHPGELIHLDIKKLGRIGSVGHRITGRYPGAVNRHHGIGWEFVQWARPWEPGWDNEHSGATATGLVAFRAVPDRFEFVVSDRGMGVLESLRSRADYAGLTDHGEALRFTLTDGVLRHGANAGRGHGFRPLFTGLANLNGALRFRSGDHALLIDASNLSPMTARTAQKPLLKGLMISVACRGGWSDLAATLETVRVRGRPRPGREAPEAARCPSRGTSWHRLGNNGAHHRLT